jgi:hypothetical protein
MAGLLDDSGGEGPIGGIGCLAAVRTLHGWDDNVVEIGIVIAVTLVLAFVDGI